MELPGVFQTVAMVLIFKTCREAPNPLKGALGCSFINYQFLIINYQLSKWLLQL